MAENLFPHLKWDQLWAATQETLYMTALSGVATFVLGIVLGLALFFAALLAHMWVGLRDVLLDYARPARLRQVLLWLVALGLCTGAASMAWLLASQHL